MKMSVAPVLKIRSIILFVAVLAVFASGTIEAGLITESGDLLTVLADKKMILGHEPFTLIEWFYISIALIAIFRELFKDNSK
ncbi:MAG: hypothetical protein ACKVT0_00820 [Planctomycetaceae bacterium]